jgi:hypothetical protein
MTDKNYLSWWTHRILLGKRPRMARTLNVLAMPSNVCSLQEHAGWEKVACFERSKARETAG